MSLTRVAWVVLFILPALGQQRTTVDDFKITVLSTHIAAHFNGEWGFAALVEAGGRKWLFDTGARPGTVFENTRAMKLDLAPVRELIVSHFHADHTGGLITLRREAARKSPEALKTVYVAEGMFYPRPGQDGTDLNPMPRIRKEYEALGGAFETVREFRSLAPGVWLTGPVPRVHPERNWSGSSRLRRPDGTEVEDTIPDDMSMVLQTSKGLVVLTGCGHAGVINILERAASGTGTRKVYLVAGGLHLFNADEPALEWTAGKLKTFGLERLVGTHCTGIESTFRLRQLLGMDRHTAPVAGVAAEITLNEISPEAP